MATGTRGWSLTGFPTGAPSLACRAAVHSRRGRAWAWRGDEPRPLSQRLGNREEPGTWAISQGQILRPPLLWMTLTVFKRTAQELVGRPSAETCLTFFS